MRYFLTMMFWFMTFLATSCGQNEAKNPDAVAVEAKPTISMAVKSQENLPVCDALNANQLVFAAEESQFYTCKEGAWLAIEIPVRTGDKTDITMAKEPVGENCPNGGIVFAKDGDKFYSCNGKDGLKGLDGINGLNGANGSDGKDGQDGSTSEGSVQIEEVYECGPSSEDIVTNSSDVHAMYLKAVKYKGGKYWVESAWSTYSFRSGVCGRFGTYCDVEWTKATQANPATFFRAKFDPDTNTAIYENNGVNGEFVTETVQCTKEVD